MNELDLFAAAIGVADPAEREALLDRECAGRSDLRRRLDLLLEAHVRSNSLLDNHRSGAPNATAAHAPASALVGAVIAGRYKLLEEIGDGGMGAVWMAEQREPVKRLVAVKLIKAGMDSQAVLARFEAERQALALMDHPNIAKVFDGGTTDDGHPFFVMELVKGLPLTEYCDARKLSVNDRLDLFVQICSAVQHAHQKAVIHRDLKPSNVLVTEHDGKPVPKVIDFGLAKALNASNMLTERTLHTAYGTVVGTPLYMAPEQVGINALDVDTRTDIYALGVMLYELLTGTTPLEKARFKEAAWDEMKRLIREEEPPKPSTRLSSSAALPRLAANRQVDPPQLQRLVRGELDWIVMKSLDKDRTRRYETANGLAKDVKRYQQGEAVEACPPTLGYRLRKAYRRNRAAVLVGSAFAGLLAASVVVTTFLAIQARRAELAAVTERVRAEEGEAEAKGQRDRAAQEQKRAEQSQRRAEEEKRAAEAVRAFLQDDLLRQADILVQARTMPQVGAEFEIKPNPTVRELLDRAAAQLTPEQIEKRFPGMPFVQAEVLHAVADAYGGISEIERGRPLIERAVALYRTVRGDTDPATLKARKSQMQFFRTTLLFDQQVELLTTYIADATRVLGPRNRDVLEARMALACAPLARNRAADAIPALEAIRAELTETFGPTDSLTLTCGATLVSAYVESKQFPVAVREMELLRDTIKGTAIRFDHPILQLGYIFLANTYRAIGDIEKAIAAYEDILDGWKQRGQPYHVNTWQPRHLLAWVYARDGNLPKGAELFEANVAAAPSSFYAFLSLDALREAEAKLGRDNQALVDRARQGLAAAIGDHGADYRSWVTGFARIRLGQQLMRMKEYAEAEAMLAAGLREMIAEYANVRDYSLNAIPEGQRSLLELYKVTNRPGNNKVWLGVTRETFDSLIKKCLASGKLTRNAVTLVEVWVMDQIAADRYDDALALYRELDAEHTPSDKPAADAWLRLSGAVIHGYGAKLQFDRMKPWAELRIPVLERDLDALRKSKPSELALLRAGNSVAFSYLYAGRKAEVVKLAEEVIARQKANGWQTDADMVASYGSMVKAVAQAGRPELAVEISSAVLAEVTKTNSPTPVLATATFSLGFARSHAGDHAEAEKHFREALRLQTEADAKPWTAAMSKAWLGFALHDQKKHDAAEPVLKEAYTEWAECLFDAPAWEKQHPLLLAERLATLYDAAGKAEEAARWKAASRTR